MLFTKEVRYLSKRAEDSVLSLPGVLCSYLHHFKCVIKIPTRFNGSTESLICSFISTATAFILSIRFGNAFP